MDQDRWVLAEKMKIGQILWVGSEILSTSH